MNAGYDNEQGYYFVKVLKEENGKGITGQFYSLKYFDKATGTIIMSKKRVVVPNLITYKNLSQPTPKQEEAENSDLELI